MQFHGGTRSVTRRKDCVIALFYNGNTHNNQMTILKYKKRCTIANKTFKFKLREHQKAFAQSLDITTNPKYVWNTCKILKNNWVKIKPSHSPENHHNNHKIEVALDKISPAWCATDADWYPKCKKNLLSSCFTFAEFNEALNYKNIGCPLNLIQFIKFQMYERIVTTEVTENDSRRISRGVPEGGVLSPLFTAYTLLKLRMKSLKV